MDTLQGGGGSDTLIGGEGDDLGLFDGTLEDYTLVCQVDGRLAVSRQGEHVILQGIEAVQFGIDRYALPTNGAVGQPVTLTPVSSFAAAQLLAATMPLLRTGPDNMATSLLGQSDGRNSTTLFGAAFS